MPQLLVGECLGVKTEHVNRGGSEWDETSIVVLDGYATHFCRVVREFEGTMPTQGERVALRVGVRAYPKRDGGAGYALTAFGRVPAVEKLAAEKAGVHAVQSA